MTCKERLTSTLRGESVDRPAINYYEIGGFIVDTDDPDDESCSKRFTFLMGKCSSEPGYGKASIPELHIK